MTRISRLPVKDKVMDKILFLLFETLGKRFDKEEFFEVIYDLLSPTEKVMIAKRVAIIFLLMKKIDYLNISNVLKVSPSTIAKFHFIMERSKGITKALNSIVRNEKITNFLEELWLEFRGPGTYGVNWSSAWKTKIALQKRKIHGI